MAATAYMTLKINHLNAIAIDTEKGLSWSLATLCSRRTANVVQRMNTQSEEVVALHVKVYAIFAVLFSKLEDCNRFNHYWMLCQHQDQLQARVKGWLHEIAGLERVGGAVYLLMSVEQIVGENGQKQGNIERS